MAMTALTLQASAFVLPARQPVTAFIDEDESSVVATAVSLLEGDLSRVLQAPLSRAGRGAQIIIGSLNGPAARQLSRTGVDFSNLAGHAQSFLVATTADGRLVVAGSDAVGTAYGIIHLTRLLGVTPWEWWADAEPAVLPELRLPEGYVSLQSPDVAYRGLRLSDIEWGLQPWANATYEPGTPFFVGPRTMQRVFELMLRLRLNLFWPPTEGAANAYFVSDECKAQAADYGILFGHGPAQALPDAMAQPLMCVDDGFGYISHFPTPEETAHAGGNGVYYHVSYRGEPHDYLWLGTASPFLMYQQLSEAYYHGAYRLWVLDAGDIKPLEYQLQLFADMGWDLADVEQTTVARHIEEFIAANVSRDIARLSSIYLKEHYHLSFQCKPEHLAGTRLNGSTEDGAVRDLPWGERRIRHRLGRYDQLQRNVRWIADSVRRVHPERYYAFYQLVEYPILAAAAQNDKYLMAQLARHGRSYLRTDNVQSTWRRSDEAHNLVQTLTLQYNALRGGKWQGYMNSNPRALAVFQPVPHVNDAAPLPADPSDIAVFYGASYNASSFAGSSVLDPVLGLGASIRAMPVPKECNVTYRFAHRFAQPQDLEVELHLLPTHPIEAQQRFTIALDGGEPQTFTYDAAVGSEVWRQNVTRNYAVVTARLPLTRLDGDHDLIFTALDDGVVIDEVFVRNAPALFER